MKDNHSDDDEGFVPTKVQIKSDNKIRQKNKHDPRYDRPIDFQSRYIYGDGIIRKQPIQVYTRFKKYLGEYDSYNINEKDENMDIDKNRRKQQNKIQKFKQSQYTQQGDIIKLIKHQKHNQSNLTPNSKFFTHDPQLQAQDQQEQQDIRKSMPTNMYTLSQNLTNHTNTVSSPVTNFAQTTNTINMPHNPTPINQILKHEQSGHPYLKYVKNQNYTLVYSRFKDRIQNLTLQNDDFAYYQVNLSKVLTKYDGDHYSVLKGFEYSGKLGANDKKKKTQINQNKPQNIVHEKTNKQSQHPQINQHYSTLRFPQSQASNAHQRLHSNSNQHQSTHNHTQIAHSSNHTAHHAHHSLSSHKHNESTTLSSSELQFDSRFQCGNLLYAFKHKLIDNYYALFLQNDTNSYGYNQWFYYSLKNVKSKIVYKFHIVNLRKRHSLFKQGMKISVFSLKDAQNNNGNGWRKGGNNIKYQRSGIKKLKDKKYKFYSLYFQLEFQHDDDYIEIAMNIPYSYSRLIHHLKICQNLAKKSNKKKQQKIINQSPYQSRRRQLMKSLQIIKQDKKQMLVWQTSIAGYSIANNAVPYLTIEMKDQKQIQKEKQEKQRKQRQKDKQKERLKEKQDHQKQPKKIEQQQNLQQNQANKNSQMINIQSPIYQQIPSNPFQPQITPLPTKKAIIIMARQHPGETWSSFMMQQLLYLLCENKNQHIKWLLSNYTFKIFPMINVDGVIYGNFRCDLAGFDTNRNWRNPDKNLHPQIYSIKNQIQKIANQYIIQCVLDLHGHSKQYNTFSYACKNDNYSSRILSLIISQLNPIFHFPYCTFGLSKYKETTARAVIYKLTGNQNILTIENSFYGAKIDQKIVVYDPQVFSELSNSILEGIYHFLAKDQLRMKSQQKIKKNIQQYLLYQRQSTQIAAADSGSDSDPFLDQISIKQKIKKILPKSFKSLQEQLQQQQNFMKKKPIIVKKLPSQKKPNKANINYKTLNPSSTKKVKSKQIQQQQQNTSKNQTFIQRTSLSHYKRNSKQIQRKQIQAMNSQDSQRNQSLNNIQDTAIRTGIIGRLGDISLPFYIREKPTLVPIKLKNDSLEIFKDAYDATMNRNLQQNQQASFRRTLAKASNKKVKILNVTQNQKKQQFPILCVLSEQKKRQNQMQKTHAFYHQKLHQKLTATSMPHKAKPYVQNEKLQYIKKNEKSKNLNTNHQQQIHKQREKEIHEQKSKIKQKNKDNATLISKIWRQNFARYGKDLNVFFGGMKN